MDDANSPTRTLWNNDEIAQVIQHVRARPFLYDKKHADYKHHQKKEIAWDIISNHMQNPNLTPRECKRKWNTLRIQKRRILNQQSKRMKSGKNTVLWQFFDALDFLMPHMEWIEATAFSMNRNNDSELEEASEQYETYDNSHFTLKKAKLEDEEDLHDDDVMDDDDTLDDDDDGHQTIGDGSGSGSNTTSLAGSMLEQAVRVGDQQQQQQQQHQQQHQQQQQQQQQISQADERMIIPYHDMHHHQVQQSANGNGTETVDAVVSPQSSTTEIIRLIHPSQAGGSSDCQTVYMTPSPVTTQTPQLISISHPVSLARFRQATAANNGVASQHHTIDATHLLDGGAGGGVVGGGTHLTLSNGLTVTTRESSANGAGPGGSDAGEGGNGGPKNDQAGSAGHNLTAGGAGGQWTTSGSANNGLSFFLLDIQMQMQKLNDIAQMELKIEMQKMLLDKLRQADNYKA